MKIKKIVKKVGISTMAIAMAVGASNGSVTSLFSQVVVHAEDSNLGALMKAPVVNENEIHATYSNSAQLRITFYRDNMFRLNVELDGDFVDEPAPNSSSHEGKMINKDEAAYQEDYGVITPQVVETDTDYEITTDKVLLKISKSDSRMSLYNRESGQKLWSEVSPLSISDSSAVQSLEKVDGEYFYGGGVTNGFVNHNDRKVYVGIENAWTSGKNSSPVPFYLSTKGYGAMRLTWKDGTYDFGYSSGNVVSTTHNEGRFDAFYFVDDDMTNIIDEYAELTGKAAMMPKYGYYLAHLNCYNRDMWTEDEDGNRTEYQEGKDAPEGAIMESLNGWDKDGNTSDDLYKFSARAVIDEYEKHDMPLGWFLPNDGYGCGYGQTDTFEGDVQNLADFSEYAMEKGVRTGLWTQQNLWPEDQNNPQKGERDIAKEAEAGVATLKTDVAWVGSGYSMALDGVKKGYEAIEGYTRPLLVSLDGWAGTQRYAGLWSGDQTGGNWEYIRMHIPTYVAAGLSGQFNVGSDIDGIYGGGNPIIQTRDIQWKSFTPMQLDMDGWGSEDRKPWVYDEPYTSINRMYLKLKAEMLPYYYSLSKEAYDASVPMVRATFLSDGNDYTYGNDVNENQFTWGDNILVAPVYQETASDAEGNDIRNDIYLPGEDNVWIDYFSGQQYEGGTIVNNFDAPLWKTPLFVKNGSIIPMQVENNSIYALNGDEDRIFEVYPSGETEFTMYDDEGDTQAYLEGEGATTKITSKAPKSGEGEAVITVQPTKGSFEGMVTQRGTQFVINVAKAPTAVKANVGGSDVKLSKASSMEDFENADGNVYFYDETPNLNKYATEGSAFADVEIIATPKLYVKVAKTDITKNAVRVSVEGFDNTQGFVHDNQTLKPETPTNVTIVEEETTEDSLTVTWDEVSTATVYEVKVNDTIYGNLIDTTFTIPNLNPDTTYTITVRSVNSQGKSAWSNSIEGRTGLDVYRNVIRDFNYEASSDAGQWPISNLFDDSVNTEWLTDWTSSTNIPATVTIDLKKAYTLDKLEYSPLASQYSYAKAKTIEVYTSLDGKNYKEAQKLTCPADSTAPIDLHLSDVKARYIRFVITSSYSSFSGAAELRVFKKDGTDGYYVGDYNDDGKIDENDLVFFDNYSGVNSEATVWKGHVERADLNENKVIDAFDIMYVAAQLEGGIQASDKLISGSIELQPSKQEVKAGETFTIDVMAKDFIDINAFSFVLPYDFSAYEVVSIPATTELTAQMRNFSKNYPNEDYLAVSFVNVGNKERINGEGKLTSITLKAKKDTTFQCTSQNGLLVNSKFDQKDAFATNNRIQGVIGSCPQSNSKITNLTDGDLSTYVYTNWTDNDIIAADKEIILDLQKTYTLDRLEAYCGTKYASFRMKYVDIYAGDSLDTMKPIVKNLALSGSNPDVIDLQGAQGRYIKIVAPKKTNSGLYIAVADLQVFYKD